MAFVDPLLDLTLAINNQVEIMREWDRKFGFIWKKFTRLPYEVGEARRKEEKEGKYAYLKSKIHVECDESALRDGSREYEVKFILSMKDAFKLLNHYKLFLNFKALKKLKGMDFVKAPTESQKVEGLPPMGVATILKGLPRPGGSESIAQSADVVFSYQFDVRSEYRDGKVANKQDLLAVRMGIWHEVMEVTLLAIAAEAFYMPKSLYDDYCINPAHSFANRAVAVTQSAIWPGREKIFLYWSGDPPFDGFEVGPMSKENELESRESHLDAIKSFYIPEVVAQNWESIAIEWEIVAETWLYTKSPHRIKKATTAWEKAANAW